jgi:hypothetical protein
LVYYPLRILGGLDRGADAYCVLLLLFFID